MRPAYRQNYLVEWGESLMVKIHGNWCGPNWTGGQKVSSSKYRGSWSAKAIDKLDRACRAHDKACSIDGCCSADDAKLVRTALKVALNPINILFRPSLVIKAQAIATGISAASRTRKC